MDQTNPLHRPDCPVTPLGIDVEGMYCFLNDEKQFVRLSAEAFAPGNDDALNALFTTEASLRWASVHFR